MKFTVANTCQAPVNPIARYYSKSNVKSELRFTAHSHAAWPDRTRAAQIEAWDDAAQFKDLKWMHAFEKAEQVRQGYTRLLGNPPGDIVLGSSTHDLLVKLLSALPLRERPQIVTTDGEFHSLRRQLDRLSEEGVEIVRVPVDRLDDVPQRLIDAVSDRTAIVMVSSVLFATGRIVPGLGEVAQACHQVGAKFYGDFYHRLNAVETSLADMGLEHDFIAFGGYKYVHAGEGNAGMYIPPECDLRPVITGWFAEFDELESLRTGQAVAYPRGPMRFAGATYDPVSHYRGAAAFAHFADTGLTPQFLREVNQHQLGLQQQLFDDLALDPALVTRDRSVNLPQLGAFLALRSPRAGDLNKALAQRGVFGDSRGHILRLGAGVYHSDQQVRDTMGLLGEVVRILPPVSTGSES